MCERSCRREGTRSNALSCYDSIMRRSLYELVPAHTYTCLQLVCMHSGCHVTYQRSRSGFHRSLLIAQKKNGILPAGKDKPVRNLRAFCLSLSDCLGLSLCFPSLRLSSDCTMHINYSAAVSGFPVQSQSQMEFCANGLLLYLAPLLQDVAHGESG